MSPEEADLLTKLQIMKAQRDRYREALEEILENEELDRTTERIATTALNQEP